MLVCMHVYVCICMCMYVYMCIYVCAHVHVCICMCVSMCALCMYVYCVCVYMYMCIYVYVCTCVHVYVCSMCVYIVCVYVYVYVYMCVHVCICMCVSMCACVYICVYMYVCVYVHVCVCAWAPPAPLRCSTSRPGLSSASLWAHGRGPASWLVLSLRRAMTNRGADRGERSPPGSPRPSERVFKVVNSALSHGVYVAINQEVIRFCSIEPNPSVALI